MSKTQPSEQVYRHKIFLDNLLGGIAWGLGSVIGATIVVSLIGFFLSQVNTIPFIGSIVENVIYSVNQ